MPQFPWVEKKWWIVGATILAVLIVIVGAMVARRRRRKEQKLHDQRRFASMRTQDNINTILVAIPCLSEERECAETLFDLFNRARCPWRINIAIVHHGRASDMDATLHEDIISLYSGLCQGQAARDFSEQISQVWFEEKHATGPGAAWCHATNRLRGDERYVMTVDCHTRFEADWDDVVLQQYRLCFSQSDRPILTTCPPEFDSYTTLPIQSGPTFPRAAAIETDTGAPQLTPVEFANAPQAPVRSWYYCSRFSFADAQAVNLVQWDGRLSFQSWADSFYQGARYWSHGWDFFVPSKVIVRHSHRGKKISRRVALLTTKVATRQRRMSTMLFHQLLDDDTMTSPDRSVLTYVQGCGVDPLRRSVQDHAVTGLTTANPSRKEIMQKYAT